MSQISNSFILLCSLSLLTFLPINAFAQVETNYIQQSMSVDLVAFPGAEGFGRYTTGGRGGDVYEVTNLNDSGPGSLRFAVTQSGTRSVVFKVSGTIHLTSDLNIRNDNISIFGQTAPGGGIATQGGSVVIRANNVIIQYVRFRPGDLNGTEPDAIWGREQSDIIIDHCSMSWSIDETASFYDNVNFTFQWNLLSESLYKSIHNKGEHGYGGIWGGQGATFHHNLLAHHTNRNPRFNGSRYSGRPDLELVDYRNNVIFNWGDNSAYGGELGNHNMVANYYKPGPATPSGEKRYRILDARPPSGDFEQLGKWYIEDNVVEGFPSVSMNNWDEGVHRVNANLKESIRVNEPFNAPELPSFESAEDAYFSVLAKVGAVLPKRDTVDLRIISEVASGTASFGGVWGAESGIIDSQEMVGGWPQLLQEEPKNDTDKDGIPDNWEISNGLDPNNTLDGKTISESGYSNLELYIHSISNNSYSMAFPETPDTVSPINQTNLGSRPTFVWRNAKNVEVYQLQVSTNANVVVLDSMLMDTTLTTPEAILLSANTTYKWRIRGINKDFEGGWSTYFFFQTGLTTSIDLDSALPNYVVLHQNYPNPFNPVTNISFALPGSAFVDLSIYNIMGKKMKTLVTSNLTKGDFTFSFDANEFPSGLYFYRLNASGQNGVNTAIVKRMLLIK